MRWTILNDTGDRKVLCRCSCGNEKFVDRFTINIKSKSCGCLQKELIKARTIYKHGSYRMYHRMKCNCDVCRPARLTSDEKYRRSIGRKERKRRLKSFEYVNAGYDTPCWFWLGSKADNGYGKYPGSGTGAHREMYKLMVGEIPSGLVLDHLCRNPICVRPSHLEPVTQRINVLRGNSITNKHKRISII